jgi:hypothetical protein
VRYTSLISCVSPGLPPSVCRVWRPPERRDQSPSMSLYQLLSVTVLNMFRQTNPGEGTGDCQNASLLLQAGRSVDQLSAHHKGGLTGIVLPWFMFLGSTLHLGGWGFERYRWVCWAAGWWHGPCCADEEVCSTSTSILTSNSLNTRF